MPKVSIVIPSFNHEKYIRECIQSVLDQTYQDFEIIITDDGSSDRSVEVIQEFVGPRIHLYTHGENKGACTAVNNCIRKASGEYIAVLSSDDAWEPTKLEKQVAYLDDHPEAGAVFTKVAFINEKSHLISSQDFKYYYVFEKENRSRQAWLNHFFYSGNCLCHPSILIRKKCYDDIGLYNERMANLPDLDMWVRLCIKYEIHILDEKLVRFRMRDDESNASGDRLPNRIRGCFESMQIFHNYLMIKDKAFFLSVFPEASKYGIVEQEYIPYFLSRLALKTEVNSWQLWGLEVLYNLLGKEDVAKNIALKYGFCFVDFYKLTAKHDVFNFTVLSSPGPVKSPSRLSATSPRRNVLLRIAIKLHWRLADYARKYILK